jgi:hypothetical protein
VALLDVTVLLVVTVCRWASNYRRFEGPKCLRNVENYSPPKDIQSHPKISEPLNTAGLLGSTKRYRIIIFCNSLRNDAESTAVVIFHQLTNPM